MTRIPSYCLDYYNKSIVQMIMEKYGMDQMEASRAFLTSETHAMLEDAALAMTDLWEAERVTGDPRNSTYLRSEI